MAELKGVLFDYGHTLVYFPEIEKIHLVAAGNMQKMYEILEFLLMLQRYKH